MKNFFDKFADGGIGITVLIFIAFLIIVALFIKELIKKAIEKKL